MDANDGHGEVVPAHEPAPPEARRIIPERPLLVRGMALAFVGMVLGWLAIATAHRSVWLTPVSLVIGATGLLSAWAAAVQLTGGVKHDDHPFL